MNSLTSRFQTEVFEPYLELLKAQYRFHPRFEHARRKWEEQLTAAQLVNGPYMEKSQAYAPGDALDTLPLHAKTSETIRRRLKGRSLYRHQTDALRSVLDGENIVVATGTSSGKTLCYQIPILDDLLRDSRPGLRAIIIYPLNALVNDQLNEWDEMLGAHEHLTFARFTGQTPDTQEKYKQLLQHSKTEELSDRGLKQQELQRMVKQCVTEHLESDRPNHLKHREAIRKNPPHVLVTNFSMLEYLLERPVDAPIFENANLKFLVLDEVHAYRGVQATEIAFLVRRLKDRLGVERLTCIATSATLGKKDDAASEARVRCFASELFGEEFQEPNPIYGTPPEEPIPAEPSARPTPDEYIEAAEALRRDATIDLHSLLYSRVPPAPLGVLLGHDENLYRLRNKVLTKPTLLRAAAAELWGDDPQREEGLQALLEIIAASGGTNTDAGGTGEQLLPARLHYFVRTQDGLHVCLHKRCPARRDSGPAFFVARKTDRDTPEGDCPRCYEANRKSKLVEVVTCRKCGCLFGALQDLGPRRYVASKDTDEEPKAIFDVFSTELGWAADSFWSYFSVEDELPYPTQPEGDDEEDDTDNLILKPAALMWCVVCGMKKDEGAGENCKCNDAHLREIKIFHRQCPHTGKAKDVQNAEKGIKKPLTSCPNCGVRNASGLEPLRRFQESEDETGLAMAIPLSHFQVTPRKTGERQPRKLLCFTDHRQRAAAFPSLLEEETFTHDMGRKIVEFINQAARVNLVDLGEHLADLADPQSQSDNRDSDFFLPVSRLPDAKPDTKVLGNLWLAETFSYFGIPDSARESAEDLGLVAVEYELKETEKRGFHNLLGAPHLNFSDSNAALQTLLAHIRQRKAFTLPRNRVSHDDLAFGRVTAEIFFALRRDGAKNTIGWLPRVKLDGSYRNSYVTDYLQRLLKTSAEDTLLVAEKVWKFLTDDTSILLEGRGNRADSWQLDHERLYVVTPEARHVCNRCRIVTAYSAAGRCPRKGCEGKLEVHPFDQAQANIIEQWVAGVAEYRFSTLKSEEHTAQINKDVAKRIEDKFRAEVEGVNLLSSTTTFEMGINIGDLQKVLLRNAPPLSASYVQRVGRAGRGRDKNAVCVTLCRRTKYDADAWSNPPRLMSGEVRTPTVFTENKIISQRHFNAAAFSKFLRIKIVDERTLGSEVEQKLALEAFLNPAAREGIPPAWIKVRPASLYLDFLGWLSEQTEADIFNTEAGCSLMLAAGNFADAVKETHEKYLKTMSDITSELTELMKDRDTHHKEGTSVSDVEQGIRNLLASDVINVLAKRGFLPRYAFPLDVVSLETGWTRWTRDKDVELSRDRGIAIAEFAPDAQVIAHKKIFTSAGLYVGSNGADKVERHWYSKCPDCEQIRTAPTKERLTTSCEICGRAISSNYIKPFVEPSAFTIRIDKKNDGAARHRRSTLMRQRQTLTHFIDSIDDGSFSEVGSFKLALKPGGKLFRYNRGPRGKGFMLCKTCGASEPLATYKPGGKHKPLRTFAGSSTCPNEHPWTNGIAYGHEFESFCLIARPVTQPLSIESVAYALQRGMCKVLEIEPSDIGVSWRWRSKEKGSSRDSGNAEIVLYDHTPGGAGFVQQARDDWDSIVKAATDICRECTCETACYDCLKDYGNQSYHGELDRHLAGTFFRL